MITETQFKEIYARYQSSGLSVRSFCFNEGLSETKFYYWKRHLRHLLPGGFGFIPVKVSSGSQEFSTARGSSLNPVFSSLADNPNSNFSLEITYPNGTRLKFSGGFDYDLVKSLVLLNR